MTMGIRPYAHCHASSMFGNRGQSSTTGSMLDMSTCQLPLPGHAVHDAVPGECQCRSPGMEPVVRWTHRRDERVERLGVSAMIMMTTLPPSVSPWWRHTIF
eukprot:COSAG03_NODE_352_length_8690_cov_166.317542_3_plen_101_part_00